MKPRARTRDGFRYHIFSAPPAPELGDKQADKEEPDPLGVPERMVCSEAPDPTLEDSGE